jgi:hypothetical protein
LGVYPILRFGGLPNSKVWVFRDLTFDHKATNNILILAITPEDLQPLKTIWNISRNTNCDTKLGEKNIKMLLLKKKT